MERRDLFDHGDLAAPPDSNRHAVDFSHAVADEDKRFGEPAREKGTGCMGQVMVDRNKLLPPSTAEKRLIQVPALNVRPVHLVILLLDIVIVGKVFAEWLIGESMGDIIDFGGLDLAFLQAVFDGMHREGAGRFFTRKTLLSRSCDDVRIADQGGGGIESLGNSILASGEIRKQSFLKRHTLMHSAETNDIHYQTSIRQLMSLRYMLSISDSGQFIRPMSNPALSIVVRYIR